MKYRNIHLDEHFTEIMPHQPLMPQSWGLTESRGPSNVLKFFSDKIHGSILFVGTGVGIDFGHIISSLRDECVECNITFSTLGGFPEKIVTEFD